VSGRAPSNRWVIGGGATVLIIVAILMWGEFRIPDNAVWNAFLAAILIGLIVAAVMLQRFFMTHPNEVGEARFDTHNRGEE
jgi:ABC-type glycerol-3-phosphate transport system permease component